MKKFKDFVYNLIISVIITGITVSIFFIGIVGIKLIQQNTGFGMPPFVNSIENTILYLVVLFILGVTCYFAIVIPKKVEKYIDNMFNYTIPA